MGTEEKIAILEEFKARLAGKGAKSVQERRSWINQNLRQVRQIVIETGCFVTVTIGPPPAIGGLVMQNIDPFSAIFDPPYGRDVGGVVRDMIDQAIGVLKAGPLQETAAPALLSEVKRGFVFVAMPMNKEDHALIDVLEAIKEAAGNCGLVAERVDDAETNERITDRILESIRTAEFVVVDLTHERPNVFYEAGFAHALGKTPTYIARAGTPIHFDVKDYPIIEFRNMKELKDALARRLTAISKGRSTK